MAHHKKANGHGKKPNILFIAQRRRTEPVPRLGSLSVASESATWLGAPWTTGALLDRRSRRVTALNIAEPRVERDEVFLTGNVVQ